MRYNEIQVVIGWGMLVPHVHCLTPLSDSNLKQNQKQSKKVIL